eukprot:SAG31_NODE_27235_length_429_cov_0.942424_1_plen_22_part_10
MAPLRAMVYIAAALGALSAAAG